MNTEYINILLVYLAAMNVVTFFLYGIDKLKAKHSKWRISEATLIWLSVFGGSIGAWLGMKTWRHKTLHKKFKYGIPFIILMQIVLAGWIWYLTACADTEKQLKQRANELCTYVPDYELLDRSCDYMTADFYAVLDTMFNLPYQEDVLHEWEFWFVATDGTPIARCACEILSIEQIDDLHITAIVLVRPEDADYEADEHSLYMEFVNGEWRMSDFDGRKADAIRYINTWRSQIWK